MERAVRYTEEGEKKISHGLNVKDMMEIEAGNKLIEFGRQKLVSDISQERDQVESELFKFTQIKKFKPWPTCFFLVVYTFHHILSSGDYNNAEYI